MPCVPAPPSRFSWWRLSLRPYCCWSGLVPLLAQGGCDATVQQNEKTPGDEFDLSFNFTGDCPAPSGDITIILHEDIGVPSRLDDAQIRISAPGRWYPDYADLGDTDDGDHEIIVAGCSGWRRSTSGGDRADCSDGMNLDRILITDLTLPTRPADTDEGYEVSIAWDGEGPFTGSINVDASLDIDGDDEVSYGETVRFEGVGFADGLTVDLYAEQGSSSAACKDISGWRQVGSTTVGSSGHFTIEVEITQTDFRNADKYQVCALDGEGTTSGGSISFEVRPGLEVAGGSDRQFAPGEEAVLRLVGGQNLNPESVLVGGRLLNRSQWRVSGDNVQVRLPPSASGKTVTILVNFGGDSVAVNVRLADVELNVAGLPNAGVGLGQRLIARAKQLVRRIRGDQRYSRRNSSHVPGRQPPD